MAITFCRGEGWGELPLKKDVGYNYSVICIGLETGIYFVHNGIDYSDIELRVLVIVLVVTDLETGVENGNPWSEIGSEISRAVHPTTHSTGNILRDKWEILT